MPGPERVVYLDTDDWAALVARGRAVRPRRRRGADWRAWRPTTRSTSSTPPAPPAAPRARPCSHRNILNNGFFTTELIDFTEHDRLCIPVPFYHCFGMVMGNLGCTTHGATMVIPAPGFDPEITLRAIAEERCTARVRRPDDVHRHAEPPDLRRPTTCRTLRTGVMAGSICPVEVMKRCIDDMHMAEVSICYGMTETSPVSTQTRADDDLDRRTATIGRVHPHVEIKVIDPETGGPSSAASPASSAPAATR